MNMKVNFTRHVLTRFKERFPDMLVEGQSVASAISRDFYKSKLESSIKNNTRFMTFIYERHGYNPVDFYVSDRVIYLVREGDQLVTVYDKKDSVLNLHGSARFRK
ncbi:hypothetical protein phiAS5_ORF0039 [Aeromonas phage phiAS5]|uniref:Uncharacterized protein n=1 Tax=Aeromonas phage phiAS5 TaxID=879630 RepID=E1A2D6_9CAUD|nr:hypothetical protein phiAS5_ORF0039 [Aeromonas phage phiAS5]ADM79882.1 hypothetical protein phiAS5_ORF0039 [Aeromonas phage phiAS5]BES53012.1 hypothetical protein [Aeromonas phage phiWae14]